MILRGHEDRVDAVAISPDNHWVVTTGWDHTPRLWDLRAKDPAANPVILPGHDGWITVVAISPDNHWVVTPSYDYTARLWDLSAKDPAANPVTLRGHEDLITAVAISPDNRWVVDRQRGWDSAALAPSNERLGRSGSYCRWQKFFR